jgi:hypothetical protein
MSKKLTKLKDVSLNDNKLILLETRNRYKKLQRKEKDSKEFYINDKHKDWDIEIQRPEQFYIERGEIYIQNNLSENDLFGNSIFEEILWTPFYRTFKEEGIDRECDPDISVNYEPYNLFALKTRLEGWLHKNYDTRMRIQYVTVPKNSKNYITAVPLIGKKPVRFDLTTIRNIQEHIYYLTRDYSENNSNKKYDIPHSNYCLIVSYDSFIEVDFTDNIVSRDYSSFFYGKDSPKQIPSSWLKKYLPFINILPMFYPIVNDEGLLADLSLVESYSETENYKKVYENIQTNIYKCCTFAYKYGWIVRPSKHIIDNWSFVPVKGFVDILDSIDTFTPTTDSLSFFDTQYSLYKPTWYYSEIVEAYGGMYSFIMTRLRGEKDIKIIIGNNPVIRHYVAEWCYQNNYACIFMRNIVSIYIINNNTDDINLKIATQIHHKIKNFLCNVEGKTATIQSMTLHRTNIYLQACYDIKTQFNIQDIIVYRVNNITYPYVISALISYDYESQFIKTEILKKALLN